MSSSLELSKRAKEIPASPIRKLVEYAVSAKKRGIEVFHVNIGQPDIPTPKEFWDAIHSYPSTILAYGHSKGKIEYREALSGYYARYGIQVTPEEIMVTTGGSEAIIFSMLAIASPGDEIIVSEPFYTNYLGFSVIAGVRLRPFTARAENGFHLPEEKEIRGLINDRTRGILLSSPCNPTGAIYTREEYERIAGLCLEQNLYFLSDEVYREFVYEGEHTSVMDIPGIERNAILLDSISKRFSACGARVGCIATRNEEIMDACLRFGQARLCSPSVEQHAATALLELKEDYFQGMRTEYRARRDAVFEELERVPGTFAVKPKGAFYTMVKFPVNDIEDFAKWLLTDFDHQGATTMIAPGPGFYASPGRGKNEARIAYVLEAEKMRKAVQILGEALKVYPGRTG
jgi:aspartate aminotransferase